MYISDRDNIVAWRVTISYVSEILIMGQKLPYS